MIRSQMLAGVEDQFDVIIIGGGATGLGAAVDAASRGYKTLLVEGEDFAKGTSSRSTKLIHGGLRYLQQGNLGLVMEALRERGILCRNAPHLIYHLPFVIPCYKWWERPLYGTGLKIYDALAGKLQIEKSRHMSREELQSCMPTLQTDHLRGGSLYYDGQFDDARLAISLAKTAASLGASVVNYAKVVSLIKKKGACVGVEVLDQISHTCFSAYGKVIVNATGVFSDELLRLDSEAAQSIITPSRGVHIVIDASFFPGKEALLIPKTSDGRVLFIIPWLGSVIIGTTDTPVPAVSWEPSYSEAEIDFLLKHTQQFLSKRVEKKDVLSVFSGLRPLIKARTLNTASLSREHHLFVSPSGLITIAGGKWTTYRKMGEDVINQARKVGNLPVRKSMTETLPLFGHREGVVPLTPLSTYGSEEKKIKALIEKNRSLGEKIHPKLPTTYAEILFGIQEEMACTLEDLLGRRTRALFLNAKAAIQCAPHVVQLFNQSPLWQQEQLETFYKIAKHYEVIPNVKNF